MKNEINISGVIKLSVLEKENKKVNIFYDDHSNIKYSKKKNNIFIDELFSKLYNNNNVFLVEEPFNEENENLDFLWSDIKHVVKSRKFYKEVVRKCNKEKKCFIYPVDIRLSLFDISLEELIENLNNNNYFKDLNLTVNDYFNDLLYLFDIKKNYNNRNVLTIKKIFEIFKNNICYKYLKYRFKIFYKKFLKNNLNTKIEKFLIKNNSFNNFIFCKGYPFYNININNFEDQYDKLINGIMEFYIIILIIGLNKTNIFLYTGSFHSSNINFILKKIFKYNKILEIKNNNKNYINLIDLKFSL